MTKPAFSLSSDRLHRPGPGTAIVALRLFWIWPAFRLAQWFMFVAVALAICEALRLKGGAVTQQNPLTWWTSLDGLVSLVSAFVLFLLLGILYNGPFGPGQCTVESARALALLPVSRRRMALARWWNDFLAQPAVFLVIMAALMLALPYPLALRAWILASVLGAVVIVVGLQMAMRLAGLSRMREKSGGLLESRLKRLDLALPLVAVFATATGVLLIKQGLVETGIPLLYLPALALIAWSAWRMPDYAKTVEDLPQTSTDSSSTFIPFRRVVRELLPIELGNSLILGAWLYFAYGDLAKIYKDPPTTQIIWFGLIVFGVAEGLKPMLRPLRMLPLRRGQIAQAVILRGFMYYFPGLALVVVFAASQAPLEDLPKYLLLLLPLALGVLMIVAVGMWSLVSTIRASLRLLGFAFLPFVTLLFFAWRDDMQHAQITYTFLATEIGLLIVLLFVAYQSLRDDLFLDVAPFSAKTDSASTVSRALGEAGDVLFCLFLAGIAGFITFALWTS